jgi:hypothetical protein
VHLRQLGPAAQPVLTLNSRLLVHHQVITAAQQQAVGLLPPVSAPSLIYWDTPVLQCNTQFSTKDFVLSLSAKKMFVHIENIADSPATNGSVP